MKLVTSIGRYLMKRRAPSSTTSMGRLLFIFLLFLQPYTQQFSRHLLRQGHGFPTLWQLQVAIADHLINYWRWHFDCLSLGLISQVRRRNRAGGWPNRENEHRVPCHARYYV